MNYKKILAGICFLLGGLAYTSHTFAVGFSQHTMDTIMQLRKKGVKIYTHEKLDIQQPSWIQASNTGIQSMPTGAAYWINRLPYEQDKNATSYIVIPRLGIVTPIVDIAPTDSIYDDIFAGLSIDFNTYLQRGVVHYPSVGPGQTGNVVIAGHSSYWKADSGRYKNIFFSLPLLEFGDQIRIYTKNNGGGYDRIRYMVEISFQTTPDNIDVIKQTTKKKLTLFTCVPIGTIQGRWVVQAVQLLPPKKLSIKRTIQR